MKIVLKLLFSVFLMSVPALADDAASVETEALEIAERLRCLVCSNENIEQATDETAKDIRFFIRKHLNDGNDPDLVVNLLLAQYGEMLTVDDAPEPSVKNEETFTIVSSGVFFLCMLLYIRRRSRLFQA